MGAVRSLQLGQLVLDTGQARFARIAAQPQKQRGCWLRRRIGRLAAGLIPGGTQQRFQPPSCLRGKPAQDASTEMPIMSMDRGTHDPIDTVGCRRFDRKLTAPRRKECGELVRTGPDGGYLISHPGFEHLSVGDGRFSEAKARLGSRRDAVPRFALEGPAKNHRAPQ